MIFVLVNLVLFFSLGLIVFYTEKIRTLNSSTYDPVVQIFKRYPVLNASHKEAELNYSTFPIPGLLKTQTLEKETKSLDDCYGMTPQGLAITENYLFISAYCSSHKHHSVIFMLDKKEAKYLKTIVLKDRTHAGGLAYDAAHHCLWVSAVAKDHGRVAAISMDDILNYDMTLDDKPIRYRHTVDFPSIYQASFITMNEGSLLAGNFDKRENGAVANISFVEEETFDVVQEKKEEVIVPKKAQGIVFYKDYCLVSQSFGPFQSKIYVFSSEQFCTGLLNKSTAVQTIKAPPYLEQIAVFGDHLYLIFESGAASYREKTAKFLTEVVAVHLPTLLEVEK
ncbi:MAG: hypothetical protein L0L87_01700 [Tetragenococcus koreensis]|nr:hypothetical protein [Tetragenococcus koreensis]MDN6846321.1 hypothetical protein [Tetragenococcus koreensis]